jgi:hypothetical protein
VIDVTCPACVIIYHADEAHIGGGFRCKVCGKILRVERLPSYVSNPGREVLDSIIAGDAKRHTHRTTEQKVYLAALAVVALGIGGFVGLEYHQSTNQSQTAPNSAAADRLKLETGDLPRYSANTNTEPKRLPQPQPSRVRKSPAHMEPMSNEPRPSRATAPLIIVPTCAQGQEPEAHATGDRIEDDEGTKGKSKLFVENGLNVDAAIRLADASTKKTARFVYIQAHDQYTITGIEPGTYTVRFLQGRDWVRNCSFFLHELRIQKFKETFEFGVITEEDENSVKTTIKNFRVSLNPVLFGTARTEGINMKEFFDGDQHITLAQ